MSEYRVVDVDAHFLDDIEKMAEYFSEPFRAEVLERDDPGYGLDRILPGTTGDRFMGGRIQWPNKRGEPYGEDEKPHLEDGLNRSDLENIMEQIGLDDIILVSNELLGFAEMRGDDNRMVEVANAYADFMLENVLDAERSIYGLLILPYRDPKACVELIERVGDEDEIVGACFVTAGPEPPLGHRRYDPVYEAAESKDLPAVFHTGGSGLDDYHVRGYETILETHTLGFLTANMSQLTSLIVQGIPEKFPDLDVVFQESGLSYVPMLATRLDTEYMKRQSEAPLLEKRPSKYMKEFYYGTQPLEEDRAWLEQVIDYIGPEQILYASDYPHWDYDEPSVITELPFLSASEKRAILGENAAEVFGI